MLQNRSVWTVLARTVTRGVRSEALRSTVCDGKENNGVLFLCSVFSPKRHRLRFIEKRGHHRATWRPGDNRWKPLEHMEPLEVMLSHYSLASCQAQHGLGALAA